MITKEKVDVYKVSDGRTFLDLNQALIVERSIKLKAFVDKIGLGSGGHWSGSEIANALSDNGDELLAMLSETSIQSDITIRQRLMMALAGFIQQIPNNMTGQDGILWGRREEVLDALMRVIFSEIHIPEN